MIDSGPVMEIPSFARERPTPWSTTGMLLAALMAALAFTSLAPPLPMAEALAGGALGLLAFALGGLALAGTLQLPIPLRRLWLAVAGFAVLALWASVQALLPLPAGWAPLWDEAAAALPAAGVVPRLSLDPPATLAALLRLLAAGAAFWLALQLGRNGARAQQTLIALVALAAIEAAAFFLGMVDAPDLAGAGLCGALALLFDRMTQGASAGRGFGPALSNFLQHLATYGLPALGAILLLGAALVANDAASAAATGGLMTLLALAAAPSLAVLRRRSLRALWIVLVPAALILGVAAFQGSGDAAADSARDAAFFALLDHPATGIGLGAADAVLPLYREQHMAELGPLPGLLALALGAGLPATAAFLVAPVFLAGLAALGVWRRRRRAIFPAAALGAIVMAVFSGAPSLASLLAWAVLVGLGVAHSFRTETG